MRVHLGFSHQANKRGVLLLIFPWSLYLHSDLEPFGKGVAKASKWVGFDGQDESPKFVHRMFGAADGRQSLRESTIRLAVGVFKQAIKKGLRGVRNTFVSLFGRDDQTSTHNVDERVPIQRRAGTCDSQK